MKSEESIFNIYIFCLGTKLLGDKQTNYDAIIADLTEQLSKTTESMKVWEVKKEKKKKKKKKKKKESKLMKHNFYLSTKSENWKDLNTHKQTKKNKNKNKKIKIKMKYQYRFVYLFILKI